MQQISEWIPDQPCKSAENGQRMFITLFSIFMRMQLVIMTRWKVSKPSFLGHRCSL